MVGRGADLGPGDAVAEMLDAVEQEPSPRSAPTSGSQSGVVSVTA
ncbi:hypothetical protein ACFQL1_08770 [Halomicroarcula sp. GCM10025709]